MLNLIPTPFNIAYPLLRVLCSLFTNPTPLLATCRENEEIGMSRLSVGLENAELILWSSSHAWIFTCMVFSHAWIFLKKENSRMDDLDFN